MKKMNLMKSFLAAAMAGGIALSANADHLILSEESLLLHSRDGANFTSYFDSAHDVSATAVFSSVGGNGGTPGVFWTSGNHQSPSILSRSGAFLLDSASLGITLTGLYQVEVTWPTHGSQKLDIKVEITDGSGSQLFLGNLNDGDGGVDSWRDYGIFTFTGAVGEEIRIWNDNPDSSAGLTMYDSVRLTQIPEPGTYAAIFGGLALLGAFVYRRRLRK